MNKPQEIGYWSEYPGWLYIKTNSMGLKVNFAINITLIGNQVKVPEQGRFKEEKDMFSKDKYKIIVVPSKLKCKSLKEKIKEEDIKENEIEKEEIEWNEEEEIEENLEDIKEDLRDFKKENKIKNIKYKEDNKVNEENKKKIIKNKEDYKEFIEKNIEKNNKKMH